ncbi:hypothetical protein D6I95_01730 [Alcaligenes faecalis]|nr:hypothetical protein D6I95_01730 [Alcaligenes faecalis]
MGEQVRKNKLVFSLFFIFRYILKRLVFNLFPYSFVLIKFLVLRIKLNFIVLFVLFFGVENEFFW